jgi:ribokinase
VTLLVIGNTALDRFFAVDRLPGAGESVLAAESATEAGGKGFNQAATARRAGAAVRFMTMLGADAAGETLARRIAEEGLDGPGILRCAGPSDQSQVLVAPGGENIVVTTTAAIAALPGSAVLEAARLLDRGDGLLMQGNLDAGLTAQALALARERGAMTILNPSPMRAGHEATAAQADVLIMNEGEAAALGVAAPLRVVSLGSRGARLETGAGALLIPAPPVVARDTTAAGDVLAGVLAALLLAGRSPAGALAAAVRAASAKVARAGSGGALPDAAGLAALLA